MEETGAAKRAKQMGSPPPVRIPRKKGEPMEFKLYYEHILNVLVYSPATTQKELAKEVGVTPAWLSMVINSNVFQERWVERQEEVKNALAYGIVGKMVQAADLSMEQTLKVLEKDGVDKQVLAATRDSMLDRIGYPKTGRVEQEVSVEDKRGPAERAWLARREKLEMPIEAEFKEVVDAT